ncbi:PhoH family protein [Fuerstiella marisgermanici]|uniref:PhoH-like protein n=1 Tax=Fuerstiella marisgermanici TaxID=1891926 RepID=A0A1P8WSI5_9PLAN|nr:PhoH family protein [Fuerstiella marisgermanici]APZ97003.1 PhoH-like protein [Fuerstiella marisgermanici]
MIDKAADDHMSEKSIQLRSQSEAQALFGPQDDYLRRLRQLTDVQIVLRGNVVVLSGEKDRVNQCEDLLQSWRTILNKNQELLDSDVTKSLDSNPDHDEHDKDYLEQDMLNDTDRAEERSSVEVSTRTREIRAAQAGRDKVSAVRAKTPGQASYMEAMSEKSLVFCDGPAGCGKTYLAVATALQALRDEEVRKIVLVRPAVEAGEKLGFLPGDMFAKVNPFVRPLLDAMNDMLDFDQVRRYMANDVIEIAPLAFMRGRTLNDTFMILDEGQNTTITQMKMFLTRMGVNSRIVVTGDATQNDLPKGTVSGLQDGIRRLSGIDGVEIVRLTGQDIVRHRLVRQIVSAYEADDSDT